MVSAPVEDLIDIVEGIGGIQHGTWRDEQGHRLKDTPAWTAFYVAARNTAAPVREEGGAVDDALKAVLCTVAFTEMADYLATTPAFKRAVEITGVDFGYLATREGAGEDEPEAWQYRTGRSDGTIGWSMWCPCDQALALQIINSGVRVMPDGTSYPAEARGLYPRAQPQAREEAQPMADAVEPIEQAITTLKGHIAAIQAGKQDGGSSTLITDCINGLPEIVRWIEIGLFNVEAAFEQYEDTPPAPEAEKLRVAVEALEPFSMAFRSLSSRWEDPEIHWHEATSAISVGDLYRADTALAALQQDAAPGEAGE